MPYLKFSAKTIPLEQHRKAATVFLRTGMHLSFILPFRIALIFFALYTLKHLSVTKGWQGLQGHYWEGLKAAYMYWPLVLLGMYTLVPKRYGNLFYDSFNLVWAVALSYLTSQESSSLSEQATSSSLS